MFRKLIVVSVVILLGLLAVAAGLSAYLAPRLHRDVAAFLSQRTGHEVELESLSWRLFPLPHFRGGGLTVKDPSRDEPLVVAREFEISFTLSGLLRKPRQLREIRFSGLLIRVSRGNSPGASFRNTSAGGSNPTASPLSVDHILIEDALMVIEAAEPHDPPQEIEIERIRLDAFSLNEAVPYSASLIFPNPRGEVQVEGSFGPWNYQNPVETPVSGEYTFREADLSGLDGIRGLLDTAGRFDGSVREARIEGKAEVTDFSLGENPHAVRLEVEYRTIRRDTEVLLEEIVSRFGESTLRTSGRIGPASEGEANRTDLKVTSESSRIEDFLLLTMKGDRPAMVGALTLDADIRIPPGTGPVRERLESQGNFHIPQGEFTSTDLQRTLEQLSRIGRLGEVAPQEGSSTFSDLSGSFQIEGSLIDFDRLSFEIPGIRLDLRGTYSFPDEQMDFRGTVAFEKSLSEMVPPEMSRVLGVLDSILRRGDAGTVIPIRIHGTRSNPRIQPDFGR